MRSLLTWLSLALILLSLACAKDLPPVKVEILVLNGRAAPIDVRWGEQSATIEAGLGSTLECEIAANRVPKEIQVEANGKRLFSEYYELPQGEEKATYLALLLVEGDWCRVDYSGLYSRGQGRLSKPEQAAKRIKFERAFDRFTHLDRLPLPPQKKLPRVASKKYKVLRMEIDPEGTSDWDKRMVFAKRFLDKDAETAKSPLSKSMQDAIKRANEDKQHSH